MRLLRVASCRTAFRPGVTDLDRPLPGRSRAAENDGNGWKPDVAGWGFRLHSAAMAHPHVRSFVAALLLIVTGCEQRVPKISNESMQELRAGLPGITEQCLETISFGGLEATPDRVDKCFQMLPPQRWKGLWRDDFEGSRFCPAPAESCSYASPGDAVWLTFIDTPGWQQGRPRGGLYAIEFIGRRTAQKGSYGHLGMSQHEVLVDRLISLKALNNHQP